MTTMFSQSFSLVSYGAVHLLVSSLAVTFVTRGLNYSAYAPWFSSSVMVVFEIAVDHDLSSWWSLYLFCAVCLNYVQCISRRLGLSP